MLLAVFYAFVFRDYDFSASSLKVINPAVPAFNFINQEGKNVSQKNTDDKVYVAEFFFTTCKGICPKMNANMRRVFDTYKADSNFMILSHTSMPETDSVPLLKMYEAKMLNGKLDKNIDGSYKIDYDPATNNNQAPLNSNWNFVTGDKAALYNMARHSYLLDNNKTDTAQIITDEFIHTQLFALVDKQTRVRGIYDGLKEIEMKKLFKDIDGLLKEKHQNRALK